MRPPAVSLFFLIKRKASGKEKPSEKKKATMQQAEQKGATPLPRFYFYSFRKIY